MKTIKILSALTIILFCAIAFGALGVHGLIGSGLAILAVAPVAGFVSLKELRENRGALVKDLQKILDTAKKENRAFSDEEKTNRKKINDDLDAMDTEIAEAERTEKRLIEAAAIHVNELNHEKEIKEVRNYSFIKAIRSQLTNGKLEGLELEMHQEAEKEARDSGIILTGIGIPSAVLAHYKKREKRDMTATGTTSVSLDQGGMTIQTDVIGFIEALRAKMVVAQAGAQMLTNLVGNIDLPGANAVATGTWEGENDDNAESSPTVRKVNLIPHRLGTYVQVSKQLLLQSSIGAENFIRNDLETAVRLGVDLAAINGSDSAGQPCGILQVTGIGSVLGGTNGAAPDWADIVALEKEVAVDNADIGALAYLTNPKVRAKLKVIEVATNTGIFVFPQNESMMNGYRALITTQCPSTLDKGTATGVCSAIIFGNWNDLIIAQWGGLDLVIDPYTDAKKALVNMVINSWWDIGCRHAESFAAMKDALTT